MDDHERGLARGPPSTELREATLHEIALHEAAERRLQTAGQSAGRCVCSGQTRVLNHAACEGSVASSGLRSSSAPNSLRQGRRQRSRRVCRAIEDRGLGRRSLGVRHIAHRRGGRLGQCDLVHLTTTERRFAPRKGNLARTLQSAPQAGLISNFNDAWPHNIPIPHAIGETLLSVLTNGRLGEDFRTRRPRTLPAPPSAREELHPTTTPLENRRGFFVNRAQSPCAIGSASWQARSGVHLAKSAFERPEFARISHQCSALHSRSQRRRARFDRLVFRRSDKPTPHRY